MFQILKRKKKVTESDSYDTEIYMSTFYALKNPENISQFKILRSNSF